MLMFGAGNMEPHTCLARALTTVLLRPKTPVVVKIVIGPRGLLAAALLDAGGSMSAWEWP